MLSSNFSSIRSGFYSIGQLVFAGRAPDIAPPCGADFSAGDGSSSFIELLFFGAGGFSLASTVKTVVPTAMVFPVSIRISFTMPETGEVNSATIFAV